MHVGLTSLYDSSLCSLTALRSSFFFSFYVLVPSPVFSFVFFFNDMATTEIYTLSLHDALPILRSCAACHGHRLKAQSLSVRVKGRSIAEYVDLPLSEAQAVFDALQLTDREAIIAERILREIGRAHV